ncbi:T9SS type A sorting domain-containing protein [Hymenobacter daeguensis]
MAQWAVGDAWPNRSDPYYIPVGLGIDGQDNLYPVGQPSAFYNNFSVIQLGAQTTVGKGTIVSRLNAYANTLRGQVYLDTNGNGQQDAGEGTFPRQLTAVLTQGSTTTYSAVGSTGELQAYADPGAYSLSLAQVPARYSITQPANGSYSGTFSGSNQLVTNQSFGITPTLNLNDIRITLTPYTTARPGFTTSYHVSVENMGTTTVSGTATVVLDSHFTYVSSTPSATRTGQTLTWTYSGLAPFGRLNYDILLSLPTNTVVGTALSSTATAPLTGDVEPTDNTSTLAQNVVASYDPNSMEVNYERITPAQVADQQWLEYTIHFQNLGTAAATTVILSDTLDFQKLNPGSIQWITQSHNCSWSLTSIGPNMGLLTVRFLGINLPYRNVDVIRSQGFVRFRVRARPTLAVGEIIPNHAGIVFDYNVPVITNTATTTVFLVTAALGRHDAPAWTAYPNPATDAVTVSADLATAGPVRVELLDVLGRPVRQKSFVAPAGPLNQALNLQGLAAGVYVLRLTPPTGPATSRQVVIN